MRRVVLLSSLLLGAATALAQPLAATDFTPKTGPAGTVVTIVGQGFRPGVRVHFCRHVLPLEGPVTPTAITVRIRAEGCASSPLIVELPGRGRSTPTGVFTLAAPPPAPPAATGAPRIVKFEPTRGPGGTRVRVFVERLGRQDQILYGGRPIKEVARTTGYVDVIVPPRARPDFFAVRSARGTAAAPERFGVVRPPIISRITPAFGAPGARVELHGVNFEPGDTVSFEGRPARVVEKMTKTRLVVQVPADAATGRFAVNRMGLTFPARHVFEVVEAPVITRVEPTEGLPGSPVRIHGKHFTKDARVMIAGRPVRAAKRAGEELLEVQVPRGAVSGPVVVQTRAGRATAPVVFLVVAPSEILGVSPPAGTPGAQVVIRVSVITGRDSFFLGAKPLPIIGRPPEGYLVAIPENAATDYIEWESFGVRRRSRFRFEVIQAPAVTGISPASGPPGTRVTIRGRNFGGDARVVLGKAALPLVERGADHLVVVVPPGAASGVLEVRLPGKPALRTPVFTVVGPGAKRK